MAFIAVALAIVLMPLAAYAIDVRTVSAAAAALQEATATAALAAAQQLDEIDFRARGVMTIDAVAAGRVARTVLAAEAPSASVSSVTVTGAEVTVAAGELVQLPFDLLPAGMVRLEARASARLADGYDRPISRVPLPLGSCEAQPRQPVVCLRTTTSTSTPWLLGGVVDLHCENTLKG